MYGRFIDIVSNGGDGAGEEYKAFEELGLTRYCCRRMLLTHVDLIDKLMLYNRKFLDILVFCRYVVDLKIVIVCCSRLTCRKTYLRT